MYMWMQYRIALSTKPLTTQHFLSKGPNKCVFFNSSQTSISIKCIKQKEALLAKQWGKQRAYYYVVTVNNCFKIALQHTHHDFAQLF